MLSQSNTNRRTHVYDYHRKNGNLVEYAGYELPVWYEGIIAECHTVRDHSGLFDVSHMGRVMVEGEDATRYLDKLTTNDVSKLQVNHGHYSLLLNPQGGIIDDITVFRTGPTRYLIVYNAANRPKNWEWLWKNRDAYNVKLEDVSDSVAMYAVQGPRARNVLKSLSGFDLESVDRYSATEIIVDKIDCLVTRTGYTGEDGFEVYVWNTRPEKPDTALHVWNRILEKGREQGLHPAGLGARDVLRLEAGMCLYGNDIDEKTNPLEARLMFVTKLAKGHFVGKETVEKQKLTGPSRVRVGFKMTGKGIPRKDQEISDERELIGTVSSGTMSPTLGDSIGMGYVKPEYSEVGQKVHVRIRDRDVPAVIVKLPFYQRRLENTVVVYGEEMGLIEFRRLTRH